MKWKEVSVKFMGIAMYWPDLSGIGLWSSNVAVVTEMNTDYERITLVILQGSTVVLLCSGRWEVARGGSKKSVHARVQSY